MSTLDTAGSIGAARLDQRRWLILGVVGLAQLMIVLDITIMNIALPSAQTALHFNNADRQWVITAYSLRSGACCCSAAGSATCSAASSSSSPGWSGSRWPRPWVARRSTSPCS